MTQVIFENATLFDGENRELRENTTVRVEDNRIREVMDRPTGSTGGEGATHGAERIDCGGRVLMPGMIDCHVHVYIATVDLGRVRFEPPTYFAHHARRFLDHILACGFTTVRDVGGGDHGLALALRDGFLEGPRYFYGGLALTQTGGHGDLRPQSERSELCACGAEANLVAVIADGVDDCIRVVREELRKGASHIKIMGSGGVMSPTDPLDRCQYSDAEIAAIVDECRRHGAYVAAHCHPDESIRRSVDLGVRSIEHGTLISAETAARVAAAEAFVVPTFSVMAALIEDGPEMGVPQASLDKLMMIHGQAQQGLEIMRDAGVKMAFGTDLLADQYTRHGTEFTIRAEVLEPFEILRSATSVGAELLGMEGQLGCIRPDALADLLVVDGNPLEDLALLASDGRDIPLIMRDGRFVKRGI